MVLAISVSAGQVLKTPDSTLSNLALKKDINQSRKS